RDDTPERTGIEQLEVSRRGGAHEDEVDGRALGQVVDRRRGRDPEDRPALAVGRVDLALVALAQDVVQGDEAELARMARRPRHDDATRLEELLHLVGATCGHAAPSASSTRPSTA